MGYEHLPQDDASDDAVDLVIESHELQRRRHIRTVLLKHGWTIINAVLLLTQLALITFYVRHIAIDQAPAVPTSYGRQFDYMSLDHQFDDLWGGEAIEKAGVIVLKEHGGRYNDIEYGAISMFHQLHCLREMRMALQEGYERKLMVMDWRLSRHWPHCMHYLRQSILCQADSFVEHEESWNGTSGFIDGSSDVRQCRDTGPLYALYNSKSAASHHSD